MYILYIKHTHSYPPIHPCTFVLVRIMPLWSSWCGSLQDAGWGQLQVLTPVLEADSTLLPSHPIPRNFCTLVGQGMGWGMGQGRVHTPPNNIFGPEGTGQLVFPFLAPVHRSVCLVMSGRVTGLEQWSMIYLLMCVWVPSVAKRVKQLSAQLLPSQSFPAIARKIFAQCVSSQDYFSLPLRLPSPYLKITMVFLLLSPWGQQCTN